MSDVAVRSAFLIRDGETVEAAWLLGGELPDIDAVIAAAGPHPASDCISGARPSARNGLSSHPSVPVRHDDELRSGALRLTSPRVGDRVERHPLHLEPDVAGDRVLHESPVVLCELVERDEKFVWPRIERLLKRTAAEASSDVAPADWPRLTMVARGAAAWIAAAAGSPHSVSKT